jgi:hypothetical protein
MIVGRILRTTGEVRLSPPRESLKLVEAAVELD